MRNEFDIEDAWLGFEIHPETPPDGLNLSERYDPKDVTELSAMLRSRAEELGLPYSPSPILANSSLALAGAEYARDLGKFASFHHEMLSAVFARGQNIGSREVIADSARQAGLDGAAMLLAIDDGRYSDRLRQSTDLGRDLGVTGVPTYIVNDHWVIVGAQPIESLRRVFRQAQKTAEPPG